MGSSSDVELQSPHGKSDPAPQVITDLTDIPPRDAVSVEEPPPNGGYAWVCTACCFMINAHTWGLNSVILPSVLRTHDLVSLLTERPSGMGNLPRPLLIRLYIRKCLSS